MQIKRVTVVGAGIMGTGIAQVSAMAGYETALCDISEIQLDRAQKSIEQQLFKGVKIGKVTDQEKDLALTSLSMTTELEKTAADSEFIIEAVPERIDLKIKIFHELNRVCGKKTIFASNTSSLSLTEIGALVDKPSRFIGMHFFNPVHKMKLVEIIRALETSDDTVKATREVSERMKKETVVITESPGFITSRINALIGNEAFYMLQEGIATAKDIDKALKLGLNHPMGPFEMVDLVGLDTRLNILEYLHKTLGDKYRPCPLMAKYVKAGRLGRKAGKGVYDYSDE